MSLTSQIRYVRALDSTATDGSGKTGIAFGSFTAKYLTHGGTLTSLTTEDITTLGTYQAPTSSAHIRIKELNSADPTKGVYEVHFHNTQLVNTGKKLWLFLSASGAACQPLEVDLIPYVEMDATAADNLKTAATNYSATRGLSGTALPAAAADAAGGLPISDAGGLDLDAKIGALTFTVANKVDANATHISGDSVAADNAEAFFDGTGYAGTNNVIPTVGSVTAGVTVTTNNDKTGYGLSAAAVQAIWDALTSALTTVGSIGKKLADWTIGTAQTGDSFARLGAPVGASISADIAAVQADLPQKITKNTALAAFPFTMVLSSDHVTGATGLTVTATRSLDGAAFGACANAVAEIANGVYKIDLAAGDLNGNTVTLKFAAATADTRIIHLATQPT